MVRRASLMAMTFALVCLLPPAHADGEIAGLRGAKKLIEGNGKTIMQVAHPTVTYTDCECDGARKTDKGFHVTYLFNWKKGNGDKCFASVGMRS